MSSQEVAEQFFNEFFSIDIEKRYSNLLEDEDMCKYYETFLDSATQECIEIMARNRDPFKYDKIAVDFHKVDIGT